MNRILFALPLLAIGVSSGRPSHAGQWVYTKIAETNTQHPGEAAFSVLDDRPAWDGSRAIFAADQGLYSFDGQVSLLANSLTPIPGEPGLNGFGNFSVDSDGIVVVGFDSGTPRGFYRVAQGSISRIVDLTAPIPEGIGHFTDIRGAATRRFSSDSDRVVFVGRGNSGQQGIYAGAGSSISRIVDASMAIPGGTGTFLDFEDPVVGAEGVLFVGYGTGGQVGLFVANEHGVRLIAEKGQDAPGLPLAMKFDGFTNPGWVGAKPTFVTPATNVYQEVAGTLIPQFLPTDTLPGLALPSVFHTITGLAVSETGYAVTGIANDYDTGIWLSRNGVLEKVIGPGDVLDGVTIFGADDEVPDPFPDPFVRCALGPQSLSGRSVVFHATFEGSSLYRQGIYIATYVPEPSSWLLAAVGCLGMLLIWRG